MRCWYLEVFIESSIRSRFAENVTPGESAAGGAPITDAETASHNMTTDDLKMWNLVMGAWFLSVAVPQIFRIIRGLVLL